LIDEFKTPPAGLGRPGRDLGEKPVGGQKFL
jgi:hypothetical protein